MHGSLRARYAAMERVVPLRVGPDGAGLDCSVPAGCGENRSRKGRGRIISILGRRDLSARKIPREDLGQQVCDRGFGFIIDQVDDPTQQATPFYEHSLNLPILSIKFRNLLFYGIIPKYAGQHR